MRVDLYSCVYMLSVSSISLQNHSYIAFGCVCISVKMTASTESEWYTIYSMMLYVSSLQLHVHRQLGVLKIYKSFVFFQEVICDNTYINDAKHIIFVCLKFNDLRCISTFFISLVSSFLPSLLLFFFQKQYIFCNSSCNWIHWKPELIFLRNAFSSSFCLCIYIVCLAQLNMCLKAIPRFQAFSSLVLLNLDFYLFPHSVTKVMRLKAQLQMWDFFKNTFCKHLVYLKKCLRKK